MKQAKLPELLSPAGDEAALRAAVDCGADAVYLGYRSFGARASAVNFDEAGLERAVRYAHLHHVRVHVTVNTLVKQQELPAMNDALRAIQRSGADAVIVQDLGVASMALRDFPALELHASTQMALCNASCAQMAKLFGFSRVVLARECSLDAIREVVQCGVETEVFVHGALCSGISGRCLMSSMSGGRSGNRGRCAQPCRQLFRMRNRTGALLSLKDLCLLDDLPALCEAGVHSLKIEGRLKSAEYVAVVTTAYRRALDEIAAGTFRPGNPVTREALLQAFNRGGFTRGHSMGVQDAALSASERVSHEGVALGVLNSVNGNFAKIRLLRKLNDGDSLQIRGAQDIEFRYSGHSVPCGKSALLRLRPGVSPRPGDPVVRLSDAAQLEWARSITPQPIDVVMRAAFEADQPLWLWMSDGKNEASVFGMLAERAQTHPSTAEDARKQLSKLGDTPFAFKKADSLQVKMSNDLFLPVSALNALRREAVEKLIDARLNAFAKTSNPKTAHGKKPQNDGIPNRLCGNTRQTSPISANTLAVVFHDAQLACELKAKGADLLIFEPLSFLCEELNAAISALPPGVWFKLPPQITEDTLQRTLALLQTYQNKLGGVVLESAGQLALPLNLPVLAGEGIPITNREAVDALANTQARGFTLWPEWTKTEQHALLPLELPALLKMYGRETLMLLNHCPKRASRGLSANRAQCELCTSEHMACGQENAELTDRKNYRFPLVRTVFPEGCLLSVLGALPTDLRAYEADRRSLGVGALLHFTTESAHLQLALTAAFDAMMRDPSFQQEALAGQPTTVGRWLNGVE